MDRFTISLDTALASEFDLLITSRGYSNRSEAVRDLILSAIEVDQRQEAPHGFCVANLSYVYNHHERALAERLTGLQHNHHDLTVAVMHTHLDHENCLESVVLKGPAVDVHQFASKLMAQSGVRHGQARSSPGNRHISPPGCVLRRKPFLPHRPRSTPASSDSAPDMDGATTKPIIDGVHRRHQFASIPSLRRIEIKLALRDGVRHQIQQLDARLCKVISRLVDLPHASDRRLDKRSAICRRPAEGDDDAL